jgi:ATP-dependent DNA helicase DinG
VAGGRPLLVHAPTGIGKSLGYLVPLAAAGVRATVATATKALQAQLIERDLPRLADAFGTTGAIALGRANYYCKAKGEALVQATLLAATPAEAAALPLIGWAAGSDTGARADAPAGTRDDAWDLVSTSGEECPGARGCGYASTCFAERARERALEADVVVTNHHLLLLELELRRRADSGGVMLPETDVVVVDEAHRLAGHAAELYGVTVRASRAGRAGAAVDGVLKALGRPGDWSRRLRASWDERTAGLRVGPLVPGSRAAGRLAESMAEVAAEAAGAARALDGLATASEELEASLAAAKRRAKSLGRDLHRLAEALAVSPAAAADAELAVWVELGPRASRGRGDREADRVVRSALVEPGLLLRDRLWERGAPAGADPPSGRRPATIACSATLAVAGSLDAAAAELGVDGAAGLVEPSPFDFANNALLYVPAGFPAPSSGDFQAAVQAEVRALVAASRGRALVLATAWRMVPALAEALADLPFELLVQGEDVPSRLVERFRDEVDSVLVGTRTFFEGIDVPGHSLSLLVLDKLPFPPPDDPLLAERGRRAERGGGGSAFQRVWLPTAAVSLQQALGRLIRAEDDRGVMAVLDRRLADAGYGHTLLDSLPPAPLTRSRDDVGRFFAAG